MDGLYRFRAEITDPTGTTTDAEIAVVVDTRAPSFRWRGARPEPLRDIGPVAFAFRTRDRSEVITVSSTVSDAAGRRVRRLAPVHTTGGRVQIVWDGRDRGGRPVGPGLYHVAFRLVDDARNVREPRPRPFRDHRAVTTTVLRRVGGAGSRIALTFDDCNDAAAWRRILKLLQDADMTASFFCIGPRVTANPVLARLTVRRGHTIGSHGWDHTDLTTLPQDAIRDRLARDAATWWRIASVTPVPFLRPPYGEVNAAVRAAGGHEGYGYAVLWDVDPEDWGVREPSSIASEVLSAARRGSIVVLHIARRTASALPAIIDGLRSRGLRSVSLTELMAAGG